MARDKVLYFSWNGEALDSFSAYHCNSDGSNSTYVHLNESFASLDAVNGSSDINHISINVSALFDYFPDVGFFDFCVAFNLTSELLNVGDHLHVFYYSNAVYFDASSFSLLNNISISSSSSSVQSLNGDYYSYPDGVDVVCYPRTDVFKVVRSYLVAYDKNSLTIMYDLVTSDGKKHIAPHEFITKAS